MSLVLGRLRPLCECCNSVRMFGTHAADACDYGSVCRFVLALVGKIPGYDLAGLVAARDAPMADRSIGVWSGIAPPLQVQAVRAERGDLGVWCRMQDSNPRPSVYKTAALPAELIRRRLGLP